MDYSFPPGTICIFPTDTQIGIGCHFGEIETAKRIFELKDRPEYKLLQTLLPPNWQNTEIFKMIDPQIVDEVKILAKEHWPGALTIVVDAISGFQPTLGLRVPNSQIAQKILEENGPLWVTSANISGKNAAQSIEEAREIFGDSVLKYFESGDEPISQKASTLLKLKYNELNGSVEKTILRQGDVVLGDVILSDSGF